MTWNPANSLSDDFVSLPEKIYADSPHWIPESKSTLRRAFSKQNPYFLSSRVWLGTEPDKARLVGFFDPSLKIEGQSVAYFGYWETIDALEPNEKLFNELKTWAKAQGATSLIGPINFNTFGLYRTRINAFEAGAFPGEPYNPRYYPDLLQALGFQEYQRYLSQVLNIETVYDAVKARSASLAIADEAKKFSFEVMDGETMRAAVKEIYGLMDAIFGNNLGYSPIPFEVFAKAVVEPFSYRHCQKTSMIVRAPDGTLAAVFLNFPDWSPLTRNENPSRLELDAIRFDEHFDQLSDKSLLMKTVGVAPQYRRLGLHNIMALIMLENSKNHYTQGVAALIREGNPSSRFYSQLPHQLHQYALFATSL